MSTVNVNAQNTFHITQQGVFMQGDVSLTLINTENMPILSHLGQAYEAEFSKITGKVPDERGVFPLDTLPKAPYTGYLVYEGAIPIGFCIVNTQTSPMYVAEFYIIPSKRKQKIGMRFAHTIFDMYPGMWQVRQIQGADYAVTFWRRVIGDYTHNQYVEEIINDAKWGPVTMQTFSSLRD